MTTNAFLVMAEPGFYQPAGTQQASIDEGVPFGSTAYNRPGSIEVLSFGFEINQVGSEEAGRPRSVEKVTRTDLKFVKAVDSRSPILFRYCCEGSFISFAELQFFGPVPTVPYLVYRLQYVHVSSYSPTHDGGVPTEEIGLRFGEMGVKWNDAGLGGSRHGNGKTGALSHNWSWVTSWPITLGDPTSWPKQAMPGFDHKSPV